MWIPKETHRAVPIAIDDYVSDSTSTRRCFSRAFSSVITAKAGIFQILILLYFIIYGISRNNCPFSAYIPSKSNLHQMNHSACFLKKRDQIIGPEAEGGGVVVGMDGDEAVFKAAVQIQLHLVGFIV